MWGNVKVHEGNSEILSFLVWRDDVDAGEEGEPLGHQVGEVDEARAVAGVAGEDKNLRPGEYMKMSFEWNAGFT